MKGILEITKLNKVNLDEIFLCLRPRIYIFKTRGVFDSVNILHSTINFFYKQTLCKYFGYFDYFKKPIHKEYMKKAPVKRSIRKSFYTLD